MARGFASIVDECLAAHSRGESLEDCLARYPKHAEELRTYLLLAERLSLTPRHQPRAAAQATAWQKVRSRAEGMRQGRRPPLSLNWLRPVAITAALVLAILAAGGGTVYASQDVLPDSPLYRVKLASEDVRVWFTFDDSSKAEMLLDQSNERTDEIMEMLRGGKPISGNVLTALRQRNARAVRILEDRPDEVGLLTRAQEQSAAQEKLLLLLWGDLSESARDDYAETVATLHNAQLRTAARPGSVTPDDLAAGVINIAGSAQPAGEGVWLLGGVEVRLDAVTLGDTAFEAGEPISVVAARAADGQFLALNVAVTGQRQEQQYVVSGAVEEVSNDEVVIGGQSIAITERTLLKLQLLRGQQVEIKVEDEDGEPTASSIERSTGDTQDDMPALLAFLAYEGIIEGQISTEAVSNDWVVGGQQFTVTPNTEIDARAGDLAEGARVRVEAQVKDGQLIARRVVVLPDDPGEDVVRVEGVLQEVDEESWTVSGTQVEARGAETPEIGSFVTLEGRREGDVVVARKLLAIISPERGGFVLLRGDISQIDEDGIWRVGLAQVMVDESAVVLGEAQQGSRVFIWASRDDENFLHAVYANVLDPQPLRGQAPDLQD